MKGSSNHSLVVKTTLEVMDYSTKKSYKEFQNIFAQDEAKADISALSRKFRISARRGML